ncbi:alpha/beta fold hydrolase [Flavilitoribacter nigricans]|uniref:Alpha/beta hydrolase n=1 Tax=Flavilitoribacter nigricans (strain ATCC 23147 / DSM 23189 / NBRC 102662 / NCIMB 1420 / SS-2) TaxID=1122177 RepID=A0A2D0MZU7_FLAN2|nr:alpha/beta hydrolase [Flavilitoribacter nigricans]PHN01419.1 alpha/beta hydrolase [Flavilitoribacter nigricans DSM 23189 = NBRC 102662]
MKAFTLSLFLLCFCSLSAQETAQNIPYGNNPAAGHYLEIAGTRLYYEIYGEGEPLLMLHGGVYGYIDEFTPLIPELAKQYQVICLATRGHGKSEIGHQPFTYRQRAGDAYELIQHLKLEKVRVIGFSDGGTTALHLAALHPEAVYKLVAMGVGEIPAGSREESFSYSAESLLTEAKAYFESRLELMPEPDRWDESLQMLNQLYNNAALDAGTLKKIKCPVLLMNGDHDQYYPIAKVVRAYEAVPAGLLSVIPGCGHVIFYCNLPAVLAGITPFLKD